MGLKCRCELFDGANVRFLPKEEVQALLDEAHRKEMAAGTSGGKGSRPQRYENNNDVRAAMMRHELDTVYSRIIIGRDYVPSRSSRDSGRRENEMGGDRRSEVGGRVKATKGHRVARGFGALKSVW